MISRLLKESSKLYKDADPYEVSEYVNQHVGNHRLILNGDTKTKSSATLHHRKAGGIDLCRLSYGTLATVRSEGLKGTYHIQFILNGHCEYQLDDKTSCLSAGEFLVLNADEPIDLTYSEDCEKFIVRIPAELLDAAYAEHCCFKPVEKIRFKHNTYKTQDLDTLMQLFALLCQETESNQATPQLLQHYNRLVASKMIVMLEHNIKLNANRSQGTATFERIVQYLEENIKGDVSAEELARYAHISLRSLYALFEKHANTTPKCFIRQKKLEHVYNTLMNPSIHISNVTAIAIDYGFTHLGRFAEFYKSTFGILPSESLKARKKSS